MCLLLEVSLVRCWSDGPTAPPAAKPGNDATMVCALIWLEQCCPFIINSIIEVDTARAPTGDGRDVSRSEARALVQQDSALVRVPTGHAMQFLRHFSNTTEDLLRDLCFVHIIRIRRSSIGPQRVDQGSCGPTPIEALHMDIFKRASQLCIDLPVDLDLDLLGWEWDQSERNEMRVRQMKTVWVVRAMACHAWWW